MYEVTRYVCETCREEFDDPAACREHQKSCHNKQLYFGSLTYDRGTGAVEFNVEVTDVEYRGGVYDSVTNNDEMIAYQLGESPDEVRRKCSDELKKYCERESAHYANAAKAIEDFSRLGGEHDRTD